MHKVQKIRLELRVRSQFDGRELGICPLDNKKAGLSLPEFDDKVVLMIEIPGHSTPRGALPNNGLCQPSEGSSPSANKLLRQQID
jgi:hypothetical protein